MPAQLRLLACLVLAVLAFGTSLANAQTAPAYFREEDTPSTCAEKCKQQKTLITTLDEFTPRQRLEMLFGAPFKIVHNKRYLMTWYGGEQVDLFVLQERDSQEPQAFATIPRGLASTDAPNVPATLWSDDNKRLDLDDITLAQALTWDQQDLDTGERKNDDVQFVNANLGFAFTPLLLRGKLSEEREFSLLFALNGAGCDKQLGDADLKFATLKCTKAATTKASGVFVALKKRVDQAPDDPSIHLLQFLADYLFTGETESEPPRNAAR
jgi:hypothetical protein